MILVKNMKKIYLPLKPMSLKMVLFTMDNGNMANVKVVELKYGKMVPITKDTGQTTKLMEEED